MEKKKKKQSKNEIKDSTLVENDVFFNNLPPKMQKGLDRLKFDDVTSINITKVHTVSLVPLSSVEKELIEQYLFSSAYELKVEDDTSEKEEQFASKSLDFLLFMAAVTCPPDQRDEIIGHLTERYQKDVERFGERKAKILLGKDIVSSWIPIAREIVRSKIVQLLKQIGLEVVLKYFLG